MVLHALGQSRATFYRQKSPNQKCKRVVENQRHPRGLSNAEKENVMAVLHEERFVDKAPETVVATLLDEGIYHCSVRTMYRLLRGNGELCERRQRERLGAYSKPELLATEPRRVWSWDTTKLKGPVAWTYFYLIVLLDIFSRYVVGWGVFERETGQNARLLIGDAIEREGIIENTLFIHNDNGGPMRSKTVAEMLSDLAVTQSFSRPYQSNDNPFSEAQFKTLKYMPTFPARFASIDQARAHCRKFFDWYNYDHRHSGIGYYTPSTVHFGQASVLQSARQNILEKAFQLHPERFVNGKPNASHVPDAVWINKPKEDVSIKIFTKP